MIKRSECRCICHTDAVALGLIEGPMHVVPCCESDLPAFDPRCNCGHLFEICPQADCTAIEPLELPPAHQTNPPTD